MTYAQHLEGALKRAEHQKRSRKKSTPYFREAVGSRALLMVKELQAEGYSFKRDTLDVLRRMAGRG